MKELIDQIGGRERMEFIAEDCAEARFSEIEAMARALLAVLDAQQSPACGQSRFKGGEWSPCSAEHAAMVMANPADWMNYECRYLYTTPPSASVPDGWKLVPVNPTQEMLNAAWEKHAIYHPSAYRTMLSAAPAPGGDGG